MVARFQAGAAKSCRSCRCAFTGSDLPRVNDQIREVVCPYAGERIPTVPALPPEASRSWRCSADREELPGHRACSVCRRSRLRRFVVIVVAGDRRRGDRPRRSQPHPAPGLPRFGGGARTVGCHPSFAQGYYDRDNDYVAWREISQDETRLARWLDEWVHGVADRGEYVARMGERLQRLRASGGRPSAPVNYGY
ncbi:MAG: hypothetical protein R2862_05595 [Thermoanaerobaculia bacterium]